MKKSIVLAAIVLLVGCQKSESKQSSKEMISADSQVLKTEIDVQTNSTPMNDAEKNRLFQTLPLPPQYLQSFSVIIHVVVVKLFAPQI